MDEPIDCLEHTKEENEAFREAFQEIHESTRVYADMKQPEETFREALQDIRELTNVYADASAA